LNITINEIEKLTAVYVRVSTNSQNEDMQLAAAARLLQDNNTTDVKYFVDHGVSATKVPMDRRPQLKALMQDIKEGKITHIITYNRDRLARDFYEYMTLCEQFYKYNITVSFTAYDCIPFQENTMIEGFLALVSELEGEAIKTRKHDSHKQFPSRIFGYKRIKDEVSKKIHYEIDESKKDVLNQLFDNFQSVSSLEQFITLLLRYKSALQTSEHNVFKILNNSFYCAHYKNGDQYYALEHVPPVTSLEKFLQVQEIVNRFQEDIFPKTNTRPLIEVPTCGVCHRKMKLKKAGLNHPDIYTCSYKHKRNMITVEDLNVETKKVIHSTVETLSPDLIKKLTMNHVNKIKQEIAQERSSIAENIIQLSTKIAKQLLPGNDNTDIQHLFKQFNELQIKQNMLDSHYNQLELLKVEIKGLISILHEYVELEWKRPYHLQMLCNLLLEEVTVSHDYILFSVYFREYLKEGTKYVG
jgi:DNA invertase Pin-like site-specific DNA recombinase